MAGRRGLSVFRNSCLSVETVRTKDLWRVVAVICLLACGTAEEKATYKIGVTSRFFDQHEHESGDWTKIVHFLNSYLNATNSNRTDLPRFVIHWIEDVDTVDLCALREGGLVALVAADECQASTALASKARQARLPFVAALSHGCNSENLLSRLQPGSNSSVPGGTSDETEGTGRNMRVEGEKEPGEFFVPHSEAADSQVLLAKLDTMGVDRALVVYDEEFANCAMKPFKEQTKRANLTMAFVPLEANRTRVKALIRRTLQRLERINSFFTTFVMIVFANFTVAERLEAELIDEGAIDPNMRMVVFYNGWDRNIGRWYFPHKTSYPYEKLIYVITRAYINETKDIMNSASHYWGSDGHAFSFPDIFTLVFLHYVMNYTSKMPMEVPGPTGCGTPMDDFMEAMKNNITREMKRLSMHSSTARYRIFYLAPVDTKWYRLKHIETWSRQNDTFSRSVLLTEVEAYLRNRTLYVVMLEYPPYAIYKKTPTGQTTVRGTFLRLMDYVRDMYNIRVSYQLLENLTNAGVRHGEYNWTGPLGMLNKRQTDLVTFLDITEPRMRSFSLSTSFISHPVAILVQRPKIMSRKMLFVQPFSTQVWVLVLASIPVVSVVLWLVYNWSPEEAAWCRSGHGLARLHNCLWYTYGALLQQGGVHLPVGTSARLVVGTWWLYVVIVMAYYSSNLIAFLTVPEPRWLVSSFREVARREDVHIYVPYGTGVEQEIWKSKNEDFLKIQARIRQGRGASVVDDFNTAIERVASGKAIILADAVMLHALVMADYRKQGYRQCRIAILNDNILRIGVSIATRKGSPYITALNREFFKLRMSGNLRFMLVNHREKQHPCIRDYNAEVNGLSKPIGLSELDSAFLLLLLGTAASSLLVPLEFAATWARTRRRARKLRLQPSGGHTPGTMDISWSRQDGGKARPVISLRHGWKQAKSSRWTTVGPGGHVLTDCYPSFGQFGRRPLYVREAPLFPAYEASWGRAVLPAADESLGRRVTPHRGHIVTVGGWP